MIKNYQTFFSTIVIGMFVLSLTVPVWGNEGDCGGTKCQPNQSCKKVTVDNNNSNFQDLRIEPFYVCVDNDNSSEKGASGSSSSPAKTQTKNEQAKNSPGTPTPAPAGASTGGAGYTEDRSRVRLNADDDCEYSATFNGGWGCNGTKGTIDTAKIANQVTQVGGAAAVQMSGQQESAKAAQSGKMSDSYNAGANITKKTGQIELATGALNVGMAAVLLYQGWQHKDHAKKAKKVSNVERSDIQINETDGTATAGGAPAGGATADKSNSHDRYFKTSATAAQNPPSKGDAVTNDMIKAFGINKGTNGQFDVGHYDPKLFAPNLADPTAEAQRQAALKAAHDKRKSHVARLLQDAGHNIAKEQSATASAANAQGMTSLITGAGQIIMGMTHMQMSKDMKKTAENLNFKNDGAVMGMPVVPIGNGLNPGIGGGISAPVIVGASPSNPNEAGEVAEATDSKKLDEKPLPGGLNKPNEFTGGPSTPQVANGGDGPSSGSPMNISGAGLQGGSSGNNEDTGAGSGLSKEPDPRYAGGSGGAYGAGGRGGGSESGPDLSKMLEKLMGGKDENFAQKPNIEEFGRDPASEPYSFLDKNVDIFQRVHQAYQSKAKAGRVALF